MAAFSDQQSDTLGRWARPRLLSAAEKRMAEVIMKRKKATVVASIACGAVCAVCVIMFMQSVRGEAEAARAEALARYGGEQLEVCVAKHDIAAGQMIESDDIELKMWVADLLPAESARSIEEVQGRAPATPIMEGEVIVLKRFEGAEDPLDVPEGLAALSVPAEDVQAVGGSLSAGAAADLYSVGGTSTTLLARDVQVLATSASGSEGTSVELAWVTLAVAPESVQEIIDASQRSELYFVLPAAKGEEVGTSSDGEWSLEGSSSADSPSDGSASDASSSEGSSSSSRSSDFSSDASSSDEASSSDDGSSDDAGSGGGSPSDGGGLR